MPVQITIEGMDAHDARRLMRELLADAEPGVPVRATEPIAAAPTTDEPKRRGGRPRKADQTPPVAENAPEPADGVGVQPDPSASAASPAAVESSASAEASSGTDAPAPAPAALPAGEAAAKPITHDDARAELNVYAEKNGMEKAKALVQRYVPAGEKPQLSKIPAERLAEFVAECNA